MFFSHLIQSTCYVAPLITATNLKLASEFFLKLDKVISLKDLITEFGEAHSSGWIGFTSFHSGFNAVLLEHGGNSVVFAYVT
jgi:hypothetical protein